MERRRFGAIGEVSRLTLGGGGIGQVWGDTSRDEGIATLLERDKAWFEQRLPAVEGRVRDRLGELSRRLGDADWLDGGFSAGDLMMVAVLLRLKPSGMLDEYPNLSAYVARGEARPAYKRAFDAQLAVFTGKPPTS